MTHDVVTAGGKITYQELIEMLLQHSVSDLMTAPAVTIQGDAGIAAAARLISQRQVKQLPVVDRDSRLIGVVSRTDLPHPYLRPDDEIRTEIRENLLWYTFWLEPDPVDVDVNDGTATLRAQVEGRGSAILAERLSEAVPGVVSVHNELTWVAEDIELEMPPS